MDPLDKRSEDEEWCQLGDLIDKARKLYDEDRNFEAIPLYLRILESDILDYETRAGVFSELGYCYYGLGEYQKSVEILEKSIELNEGRRDHSGFCRVLGSSYFEIEQYSKALNYQKRAYRLSQDVEEKVNLLFRIGRNYLFLNQARKAKKYLRKYHRTLSTNDIEEKYNVFYNLGFAHIMTGDWSKAQKNFQILIDQNRNAEDIARGYFGLAHLYYSNAELGKVKSCTERILEVYPQFSRLEKVLYFRIKSESEPDKKAELIKAFVDEYPESEFVDELRKWNE